MLRIVSTDDLIEPILVDVLAVRNLDHYSVGQREDIRETSEHFELEFVTFIVANEQLRIAGVQSLFEVKCVRICLVMRLWSGNRIARSRAMLQV